MLKVLGQDDRGGVPLPASVLERVNRLLGHDFSHVRIHTGTAVADAAATLGARALTLGTHIYFGVGQYAPGTTAGERLLVHELVHVMQYDQGRLGSVATGGRAMSRPGDAAEQEAEAAEAVATTEVGLPGETAVLPTQASASAGGLSSAGRPSAPGQATFVLRKSLPGMDFDAVESEGASSEAAESMPGDGTQAPGPIEKEAVAGPDASDSQEAAHVEAPAETKPAPAVNAATQSEGKDEALAEVEPHAELQALAAEKAPAEAMPAGGGGRGGGGAAAEKAQSDAPPEVAQVPPAEAMARLQGLRPDRIAAALGGVNAAVSRDVGERQQSLSQNPPTLSSDGENAATAAAGQEARARAGKGDASLAGAPGGAAQASPETTAGQTSGAEASIPPAARSREGSQSAAPPMDAASATNSRTQARAEPPGTPSVRRASAPPPGQSGGQQLSDSDARRLEQSIQTLPTKDPNVGTDPGPAPTLDLSGPADPAQTEKQRTELEQKLRGAGVAAQQDISQPMGEDHIEPTVAIEMLRATLAAPGQAAAGRVGAGQSRAKASVSALDERGMPWAWSQRR